VLTIRNHQIEAMQGMFVAEYVARALPLLREELAVDCTKFEAPALEAMLRRRVGDAVALGIASEANVYRFLRVMVALGPTLADGPLPRWVVEGASLHHEEEERVEAICERAATTLTEGTTW